MALFGLGSFACADLVGTVEVSEPGPNDAGNDAAVNPPSGCEQGATRCQGSVLQQCIDGFGWMSTERCGSAALCVDGAGEVSRCVDETCEPGVVCKGSALQQCNADLTGFDLIDTCDSPAHCDAGSGVCQQAACTPGQISCNGPALQRCNAGQTNYDVITSCATAALCDDLVADRCGVNLASCDVTGAVCPAPLCEQNQLRCDGTRLELCKPGRNGWDFVDECVTAGVCGLTLANPVAVTCIEPPCEPGQSICSPTGAILECDVAQTGFTVQTAQCRSVDFCLPEGCQADPCIAGTSSCNDKDLQECQVSADGANISRVTILDCLTRTLCEASVARGPVVPQACVPPRCAAGEFDCAGRQMQVCNAARTEFVNHQLCATDALCEAGAGLGACPTPCSGFECAGAILRGCNAGLTARADLENCGTAAQCDSVGGRCSDPCEPGAVRCNGLGLEECRSRIEGWTRIDTCDTAGLCTQSAAANRRTCDEPACALNQHRCVGQRLEVCTVDRNAFSLVSTCAAGQICDAPNRQCDVCSPSSVDCEGDLFARCSANGQEETNTQCGVGLCSEAGPNIGCLRCPVANAFRCDNLGSLFQCASNQLSETQTDVCRTPQLCRANSGQCLDCDLVGSSRCQGAQVLACVAGNLENVADVCASAALCETTGSTSRCEASPCTVNFQCTLSGEVLACNPERTGYLPQTPPVVCASPALCDVTAPTGCDPPACSAGQLGCAGQTLNRCNAGFTAIDQALDVCGSNSLCQEAVTTQNTTCPDCLPALNECASSTQIRTCQNRQILLTSCAAGLTCDGSGGGPVCRCQPGTHRCVAAGLEECNGAGTAFVAVTNDLDCDGATRVSCNGLSVVRNTCADAAHCAASSGAVCAQCIANAECTDSLACNGTETCNLTTHACQGGTAPCPSDGNFCNGTESCQESGGCISSGSPCVGAEVCAEALDDCVQCVNDSDCPSGSCAANVCNTGSADGGT